MGKLKINNQCGIYPLPPNHISFNVELVGEAIKITTSKDCDISIKGIDIYARRRNETKIKLAMDLLYDNLVFKK